MPEPIKNILNRDLITRLGEQIAAVHPAFATDAFVVSVMDESWEGLELMARCRNITVNLGKFLPKDYPAAIGILDKIAPQSGTWLNSFALYFPQFVELFGQREEHWEVSIGALARYTPHASAEFAVRPFIINHPQRMVEQMYAWANSDCEHIRRLASEGCRPALPWGVALADFKRDPSPILPILERLKADPSLYVRKSVANNLNDISKTHSDLVLQLVRRWHGKDKHTDWIIKHGCRTLLKRGNREALELFGYGESEPVQVSDFALSADKVAVGEKLAFSFTVTAKSDTKVRLEYAIDYVKSGGKVSRKVFQLSEVALSGGVAKSYTRSHSFADLSTRRHYIGRHAVALVVNGVEQGKLEFEVV